MLLKRTVTRAHGTRWLTLWTVLAIFAGAMIITNVSMGDDIPDTFAGTTPYAAAVGVACAIFAVIAGVRAAVRFAVVEKIDGTRAIQIKGVRDRIEIAMPARVACAWHMGLRMQGKRLQRHPVLSMVISDATGPRVVLREGRKPSYRPPAGWPEGIARAPGAQWFEAFARLDLVAVAAKLRELGAERVEPELAQPS